MNAIQMLPEKHDFLKKGLPLIIIGFAVFVCYLYFFVGIPQLAEVLQRTNLLILSLAVFLMILDTIFYTLSWQYLLQSLSVGARFRDVLCFTWISIFVDLIIPSESISGDVAKVYLLSNKSTGKAGKIAASVIVQRIIFGFVTLASVIAGLLTCAASQYNTLMKISNIIFAMILTSSFFLVLLILFVIKPSWTKRFADIALRIGEFISCRRLKREDLKPKVTEFLEVFYKASRIFWRQPKKLFFPTITAILSYIASVLVFFTAFASLGYIVPLSIILIVYSIGITVQYIPFGVPAEIGVTEIVMISFFSIFIPSKEISAAGTILTRSMTVLFRLIIGFILIEWVGVRALTKAPETRNTLSD